MKPWLECPEITVDLDRPVRERFDDVPQAHLDRGGLLLAAIMAEIPSSVRYLADAVRLRTMGYFHEEMVALAKRVGVEWRSVMLANLTYDLVLAQFGCSTLAIGTPSGPALARNMDFPPEDILAQSSALIRMERGGQLAVANAGWPGTVGVVTGMSGKGFAIALNAVAGPEGSRKTGYPVLLFLRKVLDEATIYDEAVSLLSTQTLASPCLLTVVGTENDQRVVLERSPTRCAARYPEGDAALVTTNDYRLLNNVQSEPVVIDNVLYETACQRFNNLTRFFEGNCAKDEITDESLLYHLTDPGVIQEITAQHIIMRPRSQSIRMFVPRRFVPNGFDM